MGVPWGIVGMEGTGLADHARTSLCYPNPFETNTSIAYTLPHDARTTITIFDHMGREIQTLIDAPQTAGTHTIPFHAAQLAGGMYYYSIRAGSYQASGKMMLLR